MTAPQPPWDDTAFRESIQATLAEFIDGRARTLAPLGRDAARLVEAAHRAASGGKRLRAAFCYWGFKAVDDSPSSRAHESAVLRAAASLELLHASALVHDDYMDASDTRRGRPATHRRFEAYHRDHGWAGDPQQYGAAAAILLGDLLLSWADEMLRTCGLDHGVVRDALGFFDTTRSEVIAGQFLDVSVQARGESNVDVAMRVLRYKSAKYSIERPLHIGASLAGGNASMQRALTAFGLPLGEAFQLRDDLLGVFGDPAVTGKPAGDDLSEGKRTVLVALALERAPREQAARLDAGLGTDLSADDVRGLQGVIDDSGAPTAVEKMIGELTDRSLMALELAPISDAARGVLRSLAMAATQRVV